MKLYRVTFRSGFQRIVQWEDINGAVGQAIYLYRMFYADSGCEVNDGDLDADGNPIVLEVESSDFNWRTEFSTRSK